MYDPREDFVSDHYSVSYTIPKGEKRDPNDNTPGPGHYKLPCKFADTPGYSGIKNNEEFRWV